MIIPDVNLLIYAYDATSQHHAKSREWLVARLAEGEPIGLAMATIVAFYRLTTDNRVFRTPLTLEEAAAAIDALLEHDHAIVLHAGERHLGIFTQLVLATRVTRDLIPDAHLAALALEHGGVVYTNDRDFDRFTTVQVRYPLATA
jgi:toxin-antitoxin system PIN domain toxin